MAQSQNKLVGTQYLDLSRLKKEVSETNELLRSIGAGVNLDMTTVVEQQVKSMLARFKTEIQKAASQTSNSGKQMSEGLRSANSQIQTLLSTTQRLAKDGTLTETRKGYDDLGRTITEVYRNGELLNSTLNGKSELSQGIQKANELYREQLALTKRIYQLRTQRLTVKDGSETAQQIDTQIADTQRLIDANAQVISGQDQEAVSRSKLVNLQDEQAAVAQKYALAVAAQQDKTNQAASAEQVELKRVQQAYQQLTNAYRQYNAAVKNGNEAGMAYWSLSAQSALADIQSVEEKLGALNLEEATRKRILDIIQQAKNAEATHRKNLEGTNNSVNQLDASLARVGSRLLQMASSMLVLRGLRTIWSNATQYAQEYYDKLNEIRIITGRSEADVARLGQSYRALAKQMNVSSTEIATAAVEFWRQGLQEDEVNQRLYASIQYAKISAMEFDQAAELITAATNTMGVSAQRVADVFSYQGDESASGPDEIGVAMQKASASAVEFGLTFEWQGAYIATISEQTRQAPQVIGTSINSIMARLHSIKQKGFNEEDEMQINDVAKALGTIDVALMDNEGNWRAMSDIFDDIALKWDGQNGKQKSYIATTMAGTRQQNYFFALMNDMAKGIEGGSRAYELYEGAINSAGTATQKYSVWQESVIAAQNRLREAMEAFYAMLDSDWMKGFYNGMAGLVEIITAGTQALDGWNLKLPLMIASAAGQTAVIYKVAAAIKTAITAQRAGEGLTTLLSGGTLGMILAGVTALSSIVTLIAGGQAEATAPIDYTEKISQLTTHRDDVSSLAEEYKELAAKEHLTQEESEQMDSILERLASSSLALRDSLTDSTGKFVEQGEAVRILNEHLAETEERINNLAREQAADSFKDTSRISEAQEALRQAKANEELWREYDKFLNSAAAQQTNFPQYVSGKILENSGAFHEDELLYWQGINEQMLGLVDGWWKTDEEIVNALDNLGLSAQEASSNAADALDTAWQTVEDGLHAFVEGPKTTQMNPYFQGVLEDYFDQTIAGIDKEAEVTSEKLTQIAADLKAKQEELYGIFVGDDRMRTLMGQYYDEIASDAPDLEFLNDLIDQINAIIQEKNELLDANSEPLPLLPNLTFDSQEQAQQEIEDTCEAIAQLSTIDIYKDLALAKEEANGFASVLSKLGEGEGQFTNLHEAVLAAAKELAESLGIVDEDNIGKIGEKLLEGLYDTYPEIADYVDTATGMFTEGWEEGISKATNPWAELFDEARMEDALKKARQDMASLDASQLWAELLDPEGRGLYEFAEDWAKSIFPDGTATEIHEAASMFVDAFFTMFEDIDTEIMDGEGRIAEGMDGIVAIMRKGANAAQQEITKLDSAYQSIHGDTLSRNEAISGLQDMMALIQSGDTGNLNASFEAMSTGAIDAIVKAMPEQIDKLQDGTYTIADFETAIRKLQDAEVQLGKDAWKDYFNETSDGLKEQSALWAETMHGIISTVSEADDREQAFYAELIRLKNGGMDISGLLNQYGALAISLLKGTRSAEELYAALEQFEGLNALQADIEHAAALSEATKSINAANSSYEPTEALQAYALLEEEYIELIHQQRGSTEYLARAEELVRQTTADVYEQAEAYGVVNDIHSKSEQAAADAERERKFKGIDKQGYSGGMEFLANAVRQAEEAGQDVVLAWDKALKDLDEAGHLEAMSAMFGDISDLAVECGGDVEEIVAHLSDLQKSAQDVSLSDMAKSLKEELMLKEAEIHGYREQISQLSEAFGNGDVNGVQAAMDTWNSFDESQQQSIADTYPSIVLALNAANQAAGDLNMTQADLANVEGELGKDVEEQLGKNAWKNYFTQTKEGLKEQSALWAGAMREIITVVSAADDREGAFYSELVQMSNEGVDISGLLDQYGALAVSLLKGTQSAEELYAALEQLENLNALQTDLEHADALTGAAKAINPTDESYDPTPTLQAYTLLEAEYTELTQQQRGSTEYLERAEELTRQTTADIYEQAAAYGVVSDLQARSAQAAAEGERERKYKDVDKYSYSGGMDFLSEAVRQAEAAGQDVTLAWNEALEDLDEAGHLEAMSAMFGDISNLAIECGGNVEEIIARLLEMQQVAQDISLSDMAQTLREEREANEAGTYGYRDQIDQLTEAFGDGGTEGVEAAMEVWNSFDELLQQSIADTYPSLVLALDEANQAAGNLSAGLADLEDAEGSLADESSGARRSVDALGKELDGAQRTSNAKYFKNTARAIEDLRHGTISVTDAFGDYNKEVDKAVQANEQYQTASKKMANGTQVATDEIDVLAEYQGNLDPLLLLQNWDQVGPMMANALAEGEDAFRRLNEAAFIVITGTSVADFSALTSGLVSVKNLAADAVNALIATGNWTTETITLPQEGAQWDPIAGVWNRTTLNTNQTVLRYTGNNPLNLGARKSSSGRGSSGGGGGRSGGGGGGSGGSSSLSVSTNIEKMLDRMEDAMDTSDHERRMAQLGQQYHETRGEIQGVLLYMEKEKKIIQGNSSTLEGYLSELEAQIEAQRAIIAKNKEGSKKYKQAMLNLEALQERHKEYSEQLVQNKIDLEELTNAMEEQQNKIRDMEIEIRQLIHDAILDREALNERMLEGQIDLENELLDVIKKRYEAERDQLIETAEAKRDALNEELDLLDEQLSARKKLNEQNDRARQLAEKEAQLARVSADPTRKKEEMKLREEIADLREEIAWELAEEEVDAQKQSIEEQIESIDDYIDYVEGYYEEMLSNPRKLIEELHELLNSTDSEIMAWLTENHQEYQTATDATREEMRRGWQEMLDDMRGNTRAYWDEVEDIIKQGDDAIIDFLKENSADYREASKLQAEAYVDEWKKKLEDLRAAAKKVADEIKAYDYTPTKKTGGSSSGSSGGSSGSGGGGGTTTTKQFVASGTGYAEAAIATAKEITYDGSVYIKDPHSNYWYKKSDAKRIDAGRTYYWKTGTTRYVKKYLEGGVATGTGLAWLDGSPQRPERVLSPYQTALFEDMIKALHAIRTIQAPRAIVQPSLPEAQPASYRIDNITVQVQRLESDADYEEMAERVGEEIMDKVTRGMTVGGIRIG